jgi:hypothetical protein
VSWLRIDDAFPQHPKIVGLPRSDRWTWLEVLAYCARYRTEGKVPPGVHEAVPAATPKTLQKYVQAGLLDEDETGLRVHDWSDFNPKDPTKAQRQARWRASHRDDDVDARVDDRVDGQVDDDVDDDVDDGNVHSRVGARARTRPVPSRNGTSAAAGSTQAAPIAAELARIGITDRTLVAAATADPLRAGACLVAVRKRATSNPAGLFRTLLESGDWPTAAAAEAAPNPRQGSPRDLHPDACPHCELAGDRHTADCTSLPSPPPSDFDLDEHA